MQVLATGLRCAVGLVAPAACAAIRARISRLQESTYRDDRGEPIVAARVPRLDGITGSARLAAMLEPVISEVTSRAAHIPLPPMPVLLALAEADRPGGEGRSQGSLLAHVLHVLGARADARLSRVFASGHVAGYEAMAHARQLLSAGVPACLVAATDSLVNAATLDWLEGTWRLKTDRNSDGTIPGEGAAAVIFARPTRAERAARVTGLGFAVEPAAVLSGLPFRGVGMADAARHALTEAGLAMHELDFRLSDATGEQYGLKEQALLLSRTMRGRKPDFPLWHCSEAIGDTGATAGLAQVIIANASFQRYYAPGPRALACGSSLAGARAVAVVCNSEESGGL